MTLFEMEVIGHKPDETNASEIAAQSSVRHLESWSVSGLRVLAAHEDPNACFIQEEVDAMAAQCPERTAVLEAAQWPTLSNQNRSYGGAYSEYYCSELADTIKQFDYGNHSQCVTAKHSSASIDELKANYETYDNTGIGVLQTNMLDRAKLLVQDNLHVCGFNPMNEHSILGGAFLGAPNFEEDLARISDLGIALVKHARLTGILKYRGGRPYYPNNLVVNANEALISTGVRVIKQIVIPEGNFWYAKRFVELPKKEQFQMSFVGNAAIHLTSRRLFTTDEAELTESKIRAHLTAMIKARVEVALLTDFGCGAFNNPPRQIAEIYKKLLVDEGYLQFFKQVEFTIINPTNCNEFKRVFSAQLSPSHRQHADKFFHQKIPHLLQFENMNIPEWNSSSTLSELDYNEVRVQIETLFEECKHWWYWNIDRKQIKARALCDLIEDTNKGQSLADVLTQLQARSDYAEVIRGRFSTRTADLLEKLEEKSHLGSCP